MGESYQIWLIDRRRIFIWREEIKNVIVIDTKYYQTMWFVVSALSSFALGLDKNKLL